MSRARREQNRKNPQPPPIPPAERRPVGRPVTPLIPLDEASLGPAMLALPNDAMRAFVICKVTLGLSNAKAAISAGYSARSPHAADVHGSRLAHDERIQAAILEEGQKLMRSEGPKSVHVLVAIRDDKTAANKDRLSAAKELLDRSGFHATTEHHVTVEHLSEAQKDQRILMLAAELGLSQDQAAKLLIGPPDQKVIEAAYADVVDAEFSEVSAPTAEEQAATEKRERGNTLRRQRRNMTPEELAAHKAQKREDRRAAAQSKFAQAQQPQIDIEDFIAAESSDGSEGLEDLLGLETNND